MDTNKLAGILAKSKKVMRRADEMKTNGEVSGANQTMTDVMSQAAPVNPSYNVSEGVMNNPQSQEAIQHTFKNKDVTKMPKEIVEAMINNPIETPTLGGAGFSATPDLIEAVRGAEGIPTPQPTQTTSTTTSVDGIREIIREELEKVIDQYIDKRLLDEEIQVKVGNTVFSGNLRPLPKKKVRKK